MGKERITLELDSELMERLLAAGVDPQAYLERLLQRKAHQGETREQREARWARWRLDNRAELQSYERFIEENGLWCDSYDPR